MHSIRNSLSVPVTEVGILNLCNHIKPTKNRSGNCPCAQQPLLKRNPNANRRNQSICHELQSCISAQATGGKRRPPIQLQKLLAITPPWYQPCAITYLIMPDTSGRFGAESSAQATTPCQHGLIVACCCESCLSRGSSLHRLK